METILDDGDMLGLVNSNNNNSSYVDNISNLDDINMSEMGDIEPGEVRYSLKLITVVIMLSTFSFVGVIGNAIAFYIFFRRRNSSTSVIFILTLAGTDFFTCLITIPYTVVFELLRYDLVYDVACKTYFFLITSTVPFSAYIMVGIALDRYFCICHPFLHAVNIARAKVIIFCMGIPALAFGIITALSYGYRQYEDLKHFNLSSILPYDGYLPENELLPLIQEYIRHHNLHSDRAAGRAYLVESRGGVGSIGDNLDLGGDDYYYNDNQTLTANNWTTTATGNASSTDDYNDSIYDSIYDVYISTQTSRCEHDNFTFSTQFVKTYQVVHALNFAVAYVAVATLYVLIYKEVYTRRAKKAKRRKNNLYLVESGKEARHKKETLHTDLHSDNGPSLKLVNAKDGSGSRREQTGGGVVGARKIVPTVKNDLGRGHQAMQTTRLATDPGEDETESLLSQQVEANGGRVVAFPPRAVALSEKVYDGRDSDEGETETLTVPPMGYKAGSTSTLATSINNLTFAHTTDSTSSLDAPFGKSEAWAEKEGQDSQIVPLARRDAQSAASNATSVQAVASQTTERAERPETNAADPGESCVANNRSQCQATNADSRTSPKRLYTLPYPFDEPVDSRLINPSSASPSPSTANTNTTTNTTTTTTVPASSPPPPSAAAAPAATRNFPSACALPPKSLPLKSTHTNSSTSVETKHRGKHWQADAQTNSIKRKRPSTVRDRNLMANIKTAIMLFMVILVFLLAFLPSLLMANELIPFHLIVFYGYFISNVVNPLIYAFMNQTFREDLRKMLSVCSR